jgi:sortase (surface protein transpeptidase)
MATKKPTNRKSTRTRQRAARPLPSNVSGRNKSIKKPTVKSKAKSQKKKTVGHFKKPVVLRELRIRFGKHTALVIQLTRSPSASRAKRPALSPSKRFLQRHRQKLALGMIILGLIGTAYFATDIFRPRPTLAVYSPPAPVEQAYTAPEVKPVTIPRSEPANLKIPDIGIDVSLTSVGRQPDNTLEVPKSADIPGWYRHSPTPGELGPSIIVGHVDSPSGPAIFWKLRELIIGQFIEIRRADNTTARFKVTSVLQFEQDNFPTDKVYGNIDHAGLRLITCGGAFNRITGQYSHNTVVFATLII